MCLDANDAGVFPQRKYNPIPEVLIQGYQYPFVLNGLMQYLSVVGASLTHFRCPHDIMAFLTQRFSDICSEHLIKVDPV